MDHNLSALSSRDFEHLSQALALKILGPGVSVFGDGKDGGREATFEGRVSYPGELETWDGYGVVQAKFRQRPNQQYPDAVSWLKGQIRDEFEAWLRPESKRERLPEYLIFTANVVLSPVPDSGGTAQIDRFISTYASRIGLKGWAVWHYDKLCRYLDEYDSIRRTYAGVITPGDVLAQLYDAVSKGIKSRSEALTVAARSSLSRRVARLSLVPEERVDAVLDWSDMSRLPVVSVPTGTLTVLVAPMGAGKSEEAERWWREGLREAAADPYAAIPVWMDARKAVPDLHAAIAREAAESASGLRRVVIDDLDGISPEQVTHLLDDARILLANQPSIQILATCRPGIDLGKAVVHELAAWPVRRGKELLDLVLGDEAHVRLQEREVQDLLTSPLQALSVASRLLAGESARVSSLELLSGLAASVIKAKRKGRPHPRTWENFARLAVRILNAGGPVPAEHFGHEAEVWDLTDTGLVVQDAGGLRFALPVFEQHFGAQALRKGTVRVEDIATGEAFPRWRYAIAFAVNASDLDEAENLMLRLARINPAAASWTFDEIVRGDARTGGMRAAEERAARAIARLAPGEHDESQAAVLVGEWLREALRTYADGFGPLSGSLLDLRDGRLPRWGVWVREGWVAISPSRYSCEPPDVTPLASHPVNREDSEWRWWSQHLFPGEPLGRWDWAREEIRKPLERSLRRGALPLPPESPLAHERLWFLAQKLRPGRNPRRSTISVPELRDTVEKMMERVRASVSYTHQVAGYTYDSADIRWLHAYLAGATDDVLRRPYGEPDHESPQRGWVWQDYSPLLTLRIARQVLRDAIIGYRQLVELNFLSFAPALGLYTALPVRVEGVVVMPEDDFDGSHSGLLYALRPQAAGRRADTPMVDLDLWTEPGFGPTTPFPAEPVDPKSNFHRPIYEDREFPTGSHRPATALAYEWLMRDLKAVGWLGGTARFE